MNLVRRRLNVWSVLFEPAQLALELLDALEKAIQIHAGQGISLGLVELDGWDATDFLARLNVLDNGGLARGVYAVADRQMAGDPDLPA